jgi:hypothetical protein
MKHLKQKNAETATLINNFSVADQKKIYDAALKQYTEQKRIMDQSKQAIAKIVKKSTEKKKN